MPAESYLGARNKQGVYYRAQNIDNHIPSRR